MGVVGADADGPAQGGADPYGGLTRTGSVGFWVVRVCGGSWRGS